MTLGLKRLGIKKQQNERRGGGKRRDTALRRPSNAAAANAGSRDSRAQSMEVIEGFWVGCAKRSPFFSVLWMGCLYGTRLNAMFFVYESASRGYA